MRLFTSRAVLCGLTLLACSQLLAAVEEHGGRRRLAFAAAPGIGPLARSASDRHQRNLRTGAWVCAERGVSLANQDGKDGKDRRSALHQFGGSVLAVAVAIGAPKVSVAEEEEEIIHNVGK